jgi:hypothetical protein
MGWEWDWDGDLGLLDMKNGSMQFIKLKTEKMEKRELRQVV